MAQEREVAEFGLEFGKSKTVSRLEAGKKPIDNGGTIAATNSELFDFRMK